MNIKLKWKHKIFKNLFEYNICINYIFDFVVEMGNVKKILII